MWNSWNALFVEINGIIKAMYDVQKKGQYDISTQWSLFEIRYIPLHFQSSVAK
jgi:hypothetical protein